MHVLDELRAGQVNRPHHVEVHLAGNGVNLARDLSGAGNTVSAVVPIRPDERAYLVTDPALFHAVQVTHPVRVNTVIFDANGVTTNVNQPAPRLRAEDWRASVDAVAGETRRLSADWIVVGGSIPPEYGTDGFDPEGLHQIADETGARICLDSPGPIIQSWLERHPAPYLVSPNVAELEELLDAPLPTLGDAADGALSLMDRGVSAVLLSLGSHGAVLATPNSRIWARTRSTHVVNSTGAGDAALAGLMSQWQGATDDASLKSAVTRAVSRGRAAVRQIGPSIRPADVDATLVDLVEPVRSHQLR